MSNYTTELAASPHPHTKLSGNLSKHHTHLADCYHQNTLFKLTNTNQLIPPVHLVPDLAALCRLKFLGQSTSGP